MKFKIPFLKFTGKVPLEVEIPDDTETRYRLRTAVVVAIGDGANLRETDLRWAILRWAILRGADLRGATLRWADLSGTDLRGTDLSGADLSGANLRGATLKWADLRGATLRGATLRWADLSGATGIPPIPKINDLDGVILKSIEDGGTLDMSRWHGDNKEWCGTTHCRAGWAIHEAGKEGKVLQDAVGISTAAALIYARSYPDLPVPDFYCNNQEALADIKSRAKAA